MKNVRFVLLLLLVLPGSRAGALEITSVVPAASAGVKTADVTFSGLLTVKNIAYEKNAVVMPVTEYKDRSYTDIKLLSKSLYWKLASCFSKAKCVYAGAAPAPGLAVLDVKKLKSAVRVANVTLVFDGELAATFGVIRKASGEIWTAYPAALEVKDRAFKRLIEKRVADSFEEASRSDKTGAAGAKK